MCVLKIVLSTNRKKKKTGKIIDIIKYNTRVDFPNMAFIFRYLKKKPLKCKELISVTNTKRLHKIICTAVILKV